MHLVKEALGESFFMKSFIYLFTFLIGFSCYSSTVNIEYNFENLVEVTDGNFDQEVLNENKLVVVIFGSSTCNSNECFFLENQYNKIALNSEQLPENIKVTYYDITKFPIYTDLYMVEAPNTVMFFKNGLQVERKLRPKSSLVNQFKVSRSILKNLEKPFLPQLI